MKTIGIVGGLGPMATVYYMELITKMTDASIDQEHPHILLESIPDTPDRTSYIIGESNKNPLNQLICAAENLEKMGADFISIPCVTAQYFYRELSDNISIPILSLCGNVAEEISKKQIDKVGILATTGTIKSKVLENNFDKKGIQVIIPDEFHQQKVMDIIYKQVKQGNEVCWNDFEDVCRYLRNSGAQKMILGCTELSLLKKDRHMGDEIVDVLEVLAQKAVIASGAKLREEYRDVIERRELY